MNLNPTSTRSPLLPAVLPPSQPLSFPHRNVQIRKRGRLKLLPRCSSPALFPIAVAVNGWLRDLVSAFPSVNSLAPALGLVSGAALYLASRRRRARRGGSAGEWVLCSSPTPFNRSVFLRCPSLEFEDREEELPDGVSERLVRRERHRVGSGKGMIRGVGDGGGGKMPVEYQRVCVRTDDGGVISLDWPEGLDLEKEQGLDTTVMLVPGNAEGSMDEEVRAFVQLALGCGFFPVVMNPRGCAGSPLTSPRLFSAADSNDVRTAIQFIKGTRPWTTLVSVGWGYGANMLTKYLGDVGEQTPLTAATCLNNPFDLEEATKLSHSLTAIDQKNIGGLKEILKSNKEIFQGKTKGFNVSKALSATSIRNFDEAISMISYGFGSIEEFYAWSNTTHSVRNIKIPLLFIQSDDSNVPFFSVPRGSISENPFTSLLMCYSSPSDTISDDTYAVIWCQNLTIEWLQAVELALLKGRHPILKDVDVSLRPSINSSPSGSKMLDKNVSPRSRITENYFTSRFVEENKKQLVSHISPEGSGVSDSEQSRPLEKERSQMLATTEALLDMLDATMPRTLDDGQRKKVLMAIGQGESLMKALEEAVPEEIRGKLMSAVSEIVQTQGRNLDFGRLVKHGWKRSMVQEKKETSTVESGGTQYQEYDNIRNLDGAARLHSGSCLPGSGNLQSSESGIKGETVSSEPKELQQHGAVFQEAYEQEDANRDKQLDERQDVECVTGEETAGTNISEEKGESGHGKTMPIMPVSPEEVPPSSSTLVENNAIGEQKDARGNGQSDQNKVDQIKVSSSLKAEDRPSYASSVTPSINVSEALNAFKTIDDSTQMAVNSVFGVIENVIDQLEKKKDRSGRKESEDRKAASSKESYINDYIPKKIEKDSSQLISESDDIQSLDWHESKTTQHAEDFKGIESKKNNGGLNFSYGSTIKNNGDRLDEAGRYALQLTSESSCRANLRRYFLEHMSDMKSYKSCPTTDLFLDPEKGCWKILDNRGNEHSMQKVLKDHSQNVQRSESSLNEINNEKIIDTSCVVINDEKAETNKQPVEECGAISNRDEQGNLISVRIEKLMCLVKAAISDVLEVEVKRKLAISEVDVIEENLASDMEAFANNVAFALTRDGDFGLSPEDNGATKPKFGTISGKLIVNIIASAIQQADHLKEVLPAGVIVGSSLACLGNYFDISASSDGKQDVAAHTMDKQESVKVGKGSRSCITDQLKHRDRKCEVNCEPDAVDSCSGDVMVGAVTAVLGASALFAHHQAHEHEIQESNGRIETLPSKDGSDTAKELNDVGKMDSNNYKNDAVSSMSDKAMSVAASVVPIKNESKVDQEWLVTILAKLGNQGGLLRFLGNIALLWGGIRGALSLNDRLIRFLRIAERPLAQRVLGFFGMMLVIWSPFVIPMMPLIVESWKTQSPMGIAGYACLFGLRAAILILIMLWGKRIRGYEFPLEQYGLNLRAAPQVHSFIKGLLGGILLVSGIHSINVLLGYACFTWPSNLPPKSAGTLLLLKAYGNLVFLTLKGVLTATCVAIVEELLFRSWLPDEITTDLGYHWAIMISGLAFAVFQRSLSSTPGFLFLSLALFGAKQRHHGSLSVPIGMRTGIMATTFLLQTGNFVSYKPDSSFWLVSSHPWHAFDGVTGSIVAILLAMFLYPWQSLEEKKA